MKTGDLIARLAAEAGAPQARRGGSAALAAGAAATLALFAFVYGLRPDLARAAADPLVAAKTLLPLALAALALDLARRSARPGAGPGPASAALRALPAAVAVLVVASLAFPPEAGRLAAFIGHSIHICLPSIALLSAPMLVSLLALLRRGAPERPGRTGALAGLAAAGLATALYSLFCTEDSPLFYGVWYSLGIGLVALAGAAAGARFLRW